MVARGLSLEVWAVTRDHRTSRRADGLLAHVVKITRSWGRMREGATVSVLDRAAPHPTPPSPFNNDHFKTEPKRSSRTNETLPPVQKMLVSWKLVNSNQREVEALTGCHCGLEPKHQPSPPPASSPTPYSSYALAPPPPNPLR